MCGARVSAASLSFAGGVDSLCARHGDVLTGSVGVRMEDLDTKGRSRMGGLGVDEGVHSDEDEEWGVAQDVWWRTGEDMSMSWVDILRIASMEER